MVILHFHFILFLSVYNTVFQRADIDTSWFPWYNFKVLKYFCQSIINIEDELTVRPESLECRAHSYGFLQDFIFK